MENNELGGLLIPRCRDRDPGGPLSRCERSRSWIPTVALPWKESRRFSKYSPSRKPPLLWLWEASRTATGLVFGLRLLQHCETRPTTPPRKLRGLPFSRHDSEFDQTCETTMSDRQLSRRRCHCPIELPLQKFDVSESAPLGTPPSHRPYRQTKK